MQLQQDVLQTQPWCLQQLLRFVQKSDLSHIVSAGHSCRLFFADSSNSFYADGDDSLWTSHLTRLSWLLRLVLFHRHFLWWGKTKYTPKHCVYVIKEWAIFHCCWGHVNKHGPEEDWVLLSVSAKNCWSFITTLSDHYVIIVLIIIVLSLYHHCIIIVSSLYYHCIIIVLSYCIVIVLSLYYIDLYTIYNINLISKY